MINNPVRFFDPTGHNWDEDFEAAHGRPPTEQDRWDFQFCQVVSGFSGWEATYDLRQRLFAAGANFETDGTIGFSMQEMTAIRDGIDALSNAMGGLGNFIQAIGDVIFQRINVLTGTAARFSPMGFDGNNRIYVKNRPSNVDITSRQVVHELAHKWDGKIQISDNFMYFRAAEPAPSLYAEAHRNEDWAESVSYFVCGGLPPGRNLSPTRQLIVSLALASPLDPDLGNPGFIRRISMGSHPQPDPIMAVK